MRKLENTSINGRAHFLLVTSQQGRARRRGTVRVTETLGRVGVGSHPSEYRRAQAVFAGPLEILDTTDEFGTNPVDLLGYGNRCAKWVAIRFKRFKTVVDGLHQAPVESGSNVPGPRQLAVVINAQHQRAEEVALPLSPAAEDELLLASNLDLQPLLAPCTLIPAAGLLGNDSFQTLLSRDLE